MMEKSQKLKQELHRLASRFNLPESDIDEELVPLMLMLEQASTKVDQASAKINDSVKPVTYNNHYGHNASAWTIWWGNLSIGIGKNIVPVLLIVLFSLVTIYGINKYASDQQLIEQARQNVDFYNNYFLRDKNGRIILLKENYVVLPDKSGIRLISKE